MWHCLTLFDSKEGYKMLFVSLRGMERMIGMKCTPTMFLEIQLVCLLLSRGACRTLVADQKM